MARVGYGRISTGEQNPEHQLDALAAAGCERVFVDVASGKLASRPELENALDYVRPGDVLVITRLNRLGRSLRHLVELMAVLGERKVELLVLLQGIDTTSPGGRLVFHIMAAIAEFEREMIVEGTRDGLEAARARGRVGGRRPKLTAHQVELARRMYDSREHTIQQIADALRVSRSTIYRHVGDEAAAS